MSDTADAHHAREPALVRWMVRVERNATVDRLEGPPRAAARALTGPPWLRDVLRGAWLGHAVHPILTDLAIGSWTSATLLDLIGGARSRQAAQRLVGIGLVAAVPTTATGLAEWAALQQPERRRVGLVHAAANVAAVSLYGASLMTRRQGRHRAGVLLALGGAGAAAAGGQLGGHLAIARKVGSRHASFRSPADA